MDLNKHYDSTIRSSCDNKNNENMYNGFKINNMI